MGAVRYGVGLVVLPLAYYGAAKSGYVLDFAGPVAAIVWLPVGVAIAFLYLGGWRYWPGVLIGDLLANDYNTLPIGSALGQTVGNLLEVFIATWLMRRLVRGDAPLESVADLSRTLAALAAGIAASATIGAIALRLGGVVPRSDLLTTWRTWWLGDFCGAVIVVPLAIAWRRPPSRRWWVSHSAELGLMIITVAALSELALHGSAPIAYVVFPALIWAALRLGPRGATLAVLVAGAFAAWRTAHQLGPFVLGSLTHSVLNAQLYISVSAVSTLYLAVVVTEREQFAGMLRASRARLVQSGDLARRRIEQDLHDGAQQRLILVAAYLGRAARQVREAPEAAPELLEEAEAVLSVAIDELRAVAHGIHPAVLSDLGLARAIHSACQSSTIPVTLLALPSTRFDPVTEATAYYVVTEAMGNAQRHAWATSISVRAVVVRRDLWVEVSDDGVGGAQERSGSGLQALRDRVEATGGTLRIDSPRDRGTLVSAAIPSLTPNG